MSLDIDEHAPEIAGFAAVVAALVPWSASFSATGFSGTVTLRFVLGYVRVVFGARAADVESTVRPVTGVGALYNDPALAWMDELWLAAAALLVVTVVLGFVLFAAGERFTLGPLDPVRLVGLLCLGMALVLTGAAWLLWQYTARTPVPVGVVLLYLSSIGLLTVDRPRVERPSAETSG